MLGFFWVYLPETKGRSLEDMSLYFAQVTGDRTVLEAEQELTRVSTIKKGTDKGTTTATEYEGDDGEDDEGASSANAVHSAESLPPVV